MYTQTFVATNGCDSISSITLAVVITPTVLVTPLIDSIYSGANFTITASGADGYLWDNSSTNEVISVSPLLNTHYCVFGTNGNLCADTACATIIVLETNCDKSRVFVPSGFSPNGDSENDELALFSLGPITSMYFVVYNRWGQIVFQTSDTKTKWNGTLNGKALNTDVFTYTLRYKCLGETIERFSAGNISLIR